MKTKLLIIILAVFNIANAQVPSWQWAKSQGRYTSHDYCYGLATDPSGNSYITGDFQDTIDFGPTTLYSSGAYNECMYLAKYNSSGNIAWAKTPGGSHGSTGKGICVDADGNFYVTGTYKGNIIFGATNFT